MRDADKQGRGAGSGQAQGNGQHAASAASSGRPGTVAGNGRAPGGGPAAGPNGQDDGGRYKWVALSNTTLSMTMATIDASIVIISLPAIFRGIGLDPLLSLIHI